MSFNLKKKGVIISNKSEFLKKYHDSWRRDLKNRNENFFMLYKDFSKFLPELSTGALKLFLFYGFNAKNETGESWYSIDTIASKLATSSRSINTWNYELERLGLIYRSADSKSSKTTFLLPYTDQVIFLDTDINSFMSDYNSNDNIKNFMGEIEKIYHFFQWRKNKDESGDDKYDRPLNLLVIVLSKEYDFSSSQEYSKKINIVFNLENYNQFKGEIDKEYMSESMLIFTFDEVYKNKFFINHNLKGVVIHPKFNILDSKNLINILNELSDSIDFDYYPKVTMNQEIKQTED